MEQRIYHEAIDPLALTQHLLDSWEGNDTAAQALEADEGIIVQIGQRSGGFFNDTPRSAVTLAIEEVDEGLRVTLGEQQWYNDGGGRIMVGGLIGFFPFFFTWPLGGGRDEPVDPGLTAQVWQSVETYAVQQRTMTDVAPAVPLQESAAVGQTTRLPSVGCPSCGTANPPAAERCRECGTFLGVQSCAQCGVSNPATANFCMRCGSSLREERAIGN
jgi:ribosomal protein L40E